MGPFAVSAPEGDIGRRVLHSFPRRAHSRPAHSLGLAYPSCCAQCLDGVTRSSGDRYRAGGAERPASPEIRQEVSGPQLDRAPAERNAPESGSPFSRIRPRGQYRSGASFQGKWPAPSISSSCPTSSGRVRARPRTRPAPHWPGGQSRLEVGMVIAARPAVHQHDGGSIAHLSAVRNEPGAPQRRTTAVSRSPRRACGSLPLTP